MYMLPVMSPPGPINKPWFRFESTPRDLLWPLVSLHRRRFLGRPGRCQHGFCRFTQGVIVNGLTAWQGHAYCGFGAICR